VRTQLQVVAAKPAAAVDLCYLTGDTSFTTKVFDQAVCDADPRLAKHASPRQVAGGSIEENILKCQLKPLNAAEYAPVAFTAGQLSRAQRGLPDRRVRLEQAGRRPAGGGVAADLRWRSRWPTAAACTGVAAARELRKAERAAGSVPGRRARSKSNEDLQRWQHRAVVVDRDFGRRFELPPLSAVPWP
jgi:hypothetical protein